MITLANRRFSVAVAGLTTVVVAQLCFLSAASAAGAHEHGAAHLDVAIDGATLEVSLESPLDNLLGFEHAPRNEKQRSAVKNMETKLNAADLFKPSPAAGCQLTAVSVDHPHKDATLNVARPAKSVPAPADAHSDADVRWTFQCATPVELQRIEVSLFARFSGLKSLKVQVAGPRGQTATTLRPGKSVLTW